MMYACGEGGAADGIMNSRSRPESIMNSSMSNPLHLGV
jgi:hypothetical protein